MRPKASTETDPNAKAPQSPTTTLASHVAENCLLSWPAPAVMILSNAVTLECTLALAAVVRGGESLGRVVARHSAVASAFGGQAGQPASGGSKIGLVSCAVTATNGRAGDSHRDRDRAGQ